LFSACAWLYVRGFCIVYAVELHQIFVFNRPVFDYDKTITRGCNPSLRLLGDQLIIKSVPMEETWITTDEAIKLSGYNPIYLRTILREGRIEGRKFGRVWQVNKASLLKYIEKAQKSEDGRYGSKP